MPGGMASGRTSISMRLDLPDGRVVIVETALYEFAKAVQEIQDRFGAIPQSEQNFFMAMRENRFGSS